MPAQDKPLLMIIAIVVYPAQPPASPRRHGACHGKRQGTIRWQHPALTPGEVWPAQQHLAQVDVKRAWIADPKSAPLQTLPAKPANRLGRGARQDGR
ncbi:hypothetical protein D3C76_1556470 [compost metagenome]